MKIVKEHYMGEHYITVKEKKNGSKVATLTSAISFGVLEIENTEKGIRIKDLEVGSAYVSPQHLAILLKEVGVADTLVQAINDVK
jgi:hypothetical protein